MALHKDLCSEGPEHVPFGLSVTSFRLNFGEALLEMGAEEQSCLPD